MLIYQFRPIASNAEMILRDAHEKKDRAILLKQNPASGQ